MRGVERTEFPHPLARAPPEPAGSLTGVCRESFENRWRLPECSSRPKNRDDGSKNSTKCFSRPQKWDAGSTPLMFARVAGFRQNRARRRALEDAVAGVGLHGWPISACRARRYAPQTPETGVSLHGFGGNPLRGTTRARRSNGEAQQREISPKPCRSRGSGERRSGGWAARVADFGVPCKAICPTSPWNEGQPVRFWRPATREPTRDAGAALAAPRRVSRVPGGIWPAKKTGAPRKECTR